MAFMDGLIDRTYLLIQKQICGKSLLIYAIFKLEKEKCLRERE